MDSEENNIPTKKSKVEDSGEGSKTGKYKQKFLPKWMEDRRFKDWLTDVKNDSYKCFCSVCNISFSCSLYKIERHFNSKTHRDNCMKKEVPIIEVDHPESTEDFDSEMSFDAITRSLEIKFAALVAKKQIPFDVAEDMLKFCKDACKYPKNVECMKLGRNKLRSIMTNVLCPVETERMASELREQKFTVFVDETSDMTNRKWMTFLVRYVDSKTNDVKTELVKLIEIDAQDCSAEKLFRAFEAELRKLSIPVENIVALSTDNASVMTGNQCSFKVKLRTVCPNVLVFPCPCHLSALVANAASSVIPDSVEKFMRKITSHINNSDKRTAIFKEFQDVFEGGRKITKFCDTRWLSRHDCIERILENWDALENFLRLNVFDSNSGGDLLALMTSADLKAYLLFLKYALAEFNYFNTKFQSEETRIHVLQISSLEFLKGMLNHFSKPHLVDNLDFLKNGSFTSSDNQVLLHEVDVGPDCKSFLNDLLAKGKHEEVQEIRQNCVKFYVKAAEDIRRRFPIDDEFHRMLNVFSPEPALYWDRKISVKGIIFIAQKIGGFEMEALQKEWHSLPLILSEEEKTQLCSLGFDEMWKKTFAFTTHEGTSQIPNLKKLVNTVRSLPNSNADAERIFSMLPDIVTKKRNRLQGSTVNAICVVKSALRARKENPLTMTITDEHLSRMSSENLYRYQAAEKRNFQNVYGVEEDDDFL